MQTQMHCRLFTAEYIILEYETARSLLSLKNLQDTLKHPPLSAVIAAIFDNEVGSGIHDDQIRLPPEQLNLLSIFLLTFIFLIHGFYFATNNSACVTFSTSSQSDRAQ